MTTRGEITGIDEYGAAQYLIKQPDQKKDDTSRLVIKFEDAIPLETAGENK